MARFIELHYLGVQGKPGEEFLLNVDGVERVNRLRTEHGSRLVLSPYADEPRCVDVHESYSTLTDLLVED